ncbi:hypothetical protein [Humibacillus sp. DSM 29435]|uniref:hypothetical protein n=1 Tax=Humibacillus sp. DSM 29435 TaxID=1869167 RepID=UPI001C30856B|nr:hypothetical protein [Humibacillus sp. DSM 29435]
MGGYFLSGAFLKARISGPTGFAAHSLYPRIGHFVATTIYDNASFWAWIIFLGKRQPASLSHSAYSPGSEVS